MHQGFLQPALLGLVAIGRDYVGDAALRIADRIEIPGGAHGAAVGAYDEAVAADRRPGRSLGNGPHEAVHLGAVGVQQTVRPADQLRRGIAGHRAEAVVDKNDLQRPRTRAAFRDEDAFALGPEARRQQGG